MTFLPEGMQGVVVQPIGSSGLLVAGTDTVRGFGRMDQVCDQALYPCMCKGVCMHLFTACASICVCVCAYARPCMQTWAS